MKAIRWRRRINHLAVLVAVPCLCEWNTKVDICPNLFVYIEKKCLPAKIDTDLIFCSPSVW